MGDDGVGSLQASQYPKDATFKVQPHSMRQATITRAGQAVRLICPPYFSSPLLTATTPANNSNNS